MKRKLIVFLAALSVLCGFTACDVEKMSGKATVEGSIFGGQSDDRISVTVDFDTDWVTKKDNRTYQPGLARFCALLSADSYFRAKDLEKQRQNRVLLTDGKEEDYTFTSLLSAAGFMAAEHFESYLTETETADLNDSVTLNVGYRKSGKYDVFAVVVRGCFSAQEWKSAFDCGCETGYEELTGVHPSWKEKEHFKGVDVAFNRALSFLNRFMERNGDASSPDRILITGHSRGGGIANLLGAYYEKKEGVTPYTYTFNAMGVTQKEDAESYETIFNIFDAGDFFTDALPFSEGGFLRYGKDVRVDLAASETLLQAAAELKGRDDYTSVPETVREEYRALFGKRFPHREMLSQMQEFSRVYESEEEAEAARSQLISFSGNDGLGLENLYSVGEIAPMENGGYGFPVSYCGDALLRSYAMILAYGEAAYQAEGVLFSEDETGLALATLLYENAAGITGGHLLLNSYVIAGEAK